MTTPGRNPASAVIEAESLTFDFGTTPVLSNVSLSLQRGETLVLMGPSGCGKSTLLRVLSGLDPSRDGTVRFAGVDGTVRPLLRFLFQDNDAFPWLTVRDNVRVGSGPAPYPEDLEVEAILRRVGLSDSARKYPAELSGGMRKRLALARCLIRRPTLLLLDEPFSSLDIDARAEMYTLLQELMASAGTSAILVTHDPREAVLLGDRIFVATRRPMRIGAAIPVELPRPRAVELTEAPSFQWLLAEVHQEIAAAARGAVVSTGAAAKQPSPATARDRQRIEELKLIAEDPLIVARMSSDEITTAVRQASEQMGRVRMGGRSHALAALCLLVWRGAERADVRKILAREAETLASLGLRVVGDPSFVQPEWGLVLTGAVLVRLFGTAGGEGGEPASTELRQQILTMVEYFAHATVSIMPAARVAAKHLLEAHSAGFPQGLRPIAEGALAAWPDTASIRLSTTREELEEMINKMSSSLPATLSPDSIRLYRLELERSGTWGVLERLARALE